MAKKERTPTTIWIEPTNVCNMRCSFCFQSNNSMSRPKGHMSLESFKNLIDDIKEFSPAVVLHHSGESFVHKQLFEFIRYAKEAGLNVRITTNGTMLDKENYGILDTGIDILSVSLAGINPSDYKGVHAIDYFDKICSDIRTLGSEKLKRGIDMKLTINVTRTNQNASQIPAFKKKFSAIPGVDEVIVRNLMSWSGSVDVSGIKYRGLPYRIRRKIADIYLDIKPLVFRKGVCDSPFLSAGVLWDGTLVPCCVDFDAKLALGNVNDARFLELWNGPKMEELRKMLMSPSRTKAHPVCGPCVFP